MGHGSVDARVKLTDGGEQEGQTTRGETLLAHVRWGVLGKDIFRLDVRHPPAYRNMFKYLV